MVMDGTVASRIAPRPRLMCGSSWNELSVKSYSVSSGSTHASHYLGGSPLSSSSVHLLACLVQYIGSKRVERQSGRSQALQCAPSWLNGGQILISLRPKRVEAGGAKGNPEWF